MVRSVASLLVLASVTFGACTSSCGHDASTQRPPAEVTVPPVVETPARPTLLLEATDDHAPSATYVTVLLGDAATLGPSRSHPTLGSTESPGWYRSVCAAHAGRFARIEHTGGTYMLIVHALADGSERLRLDLGASEPHAMMLTETGAFIGAVTNVRYVDLEARTPHVTTLVSREDMGRKAYDVFARAGDRVVAIDDVVRPIYADYFQLRPHGEPTHLADWEMPPLINGMYRHAVLVPTSAENHTLYVVAPYGILDGNGQDVAAIPIEGNRVGVPSTNPMNSGGRTPWVIEEHASRVTGGPSTFLAGNELTLFTGIAFAHEKVLLPAGARGLFVLPASFDGVSRADVVPDLGEVHDVTTAYDRVFALTSTNGAHALAELAFANGAFTVAMRTPLPAPYVRFVD